MLGLDPKLVLHHFPLFPNTTPINKKLRKMHPQIALLVKAELKKLLEVGFIQPIEYVEWISNLVPITKPTSAIKFFIYFRDLNKAFPKDDFLLPNTDIIVDFTTRYEMLSLMDSFLGYNQIRISLKDQHKIAFTCFWGTYCWNVIPFGLKNTREPYQKVISTIFHDYMHTLMEDYVDDLLAKSLSRDNHLVMLDNIFKRLEEYKVILNPKKCVFGAQSGNILGYVVSCRGIEVDPPKVKAIMDIPLSPTNISQLHTLRGKLRSI